MRNFLILLVTAITMTACTTQRPSDLEYYKKFIENRHSAQLQTPLTLKDKNGKTVAILYSGCIIQSPSPDDVGDTDMSDNNRAKVVFDILSDAKKQKIEGMPILTGHQTE